MRIGARPLDRIPDPIRTPLQGPLARPFFHLRDRREKTSARDSHAAACSPGLRSENARISMAKARQTIDSTRRYGRHTGAWLSENQNQRQVIPSAPSRLAVYERQLVLGDDRPPRFGSVK